MKKLIIGTMLLGLTNLGYAQSTNGKVEEVKLSEVEVAPRNMDYINKVSEGTIAPRVLALEKEASRFNIKESPWYNKGSKVFYIFFKQKDGYIRATYDRDGRILTSSERFKDIALPTAIRNSIYKEYPGWTLNKVLYSVAYDQGSDIKKMYKAQLRKGDAKVNMKLGATGERND